MGQEALPTVSSEEDRMALQASTSGMWTRLQGTLATHTWLRGLGASTPGGMRTAHLRGRMRSSRRPCSSQDLSSSSLCTTCPRQAHPHMCQQYLTLIKWTVHWGNPLDVRRLSGCQDTMQRPCALGFAGTAAPLRAFMSDAFATRHECGQQSISTGAGI